MSSLFGFEIAVDDVVAVAVLDSAHYLLEEPPGVCLGHSADLCAPERQTSASTVGRGQHPGTHMDDVVEELALEVFDDHDDVRMILDHVVPERTFQSHPA